MEKEMKTKLFFFISVALVVFSGLMAYGIQTGFGTIDVQEVKIVDEFGGSQVVGKLYRPVDVTMMTPAPGILGLHGYNNDKEVQQGTALELARAGFVVLIIDEIGHGDSEGSISWYLQGADAAYKWLAGLSFVDGDKMGIYGHSMGYIVAEQVALANPDHDALIFQSFAPLPHNFTFTHNVLHIWAEWEEFFSYGAGGYTDDMTVGDIYARGLEITGDNAGLPGDGVVATNYGDFTLGTAYREYYAVATTHPGESMDSGANAEAVAWMLQGLNDETEVDAWAAQVALGQTYVYLEVFGGLALLFTFVSIIFLTKWLLTLGFFKEVQQPIPDKQILKKKYTWWLFAAINATISAFAYIYFTHADVDWKWQDPIFGADSPFVFGVLNNLLGFFLVSAAIGGGFVTLWFFLVRMRERDAVNLYDLGVTYDKSISKKAGLQIFGKTLIVAFILIGWMYLLVSIFQTLFMVEFRIFWSFMQMITLERLPSFLIYLPIMVPFFLINGGMFLFGQIKQKEESTPWKTQLVWTVKGWFAMLTGLIAVILIQYIPAMAGANFAFIGFDFNPIMPIQLMSVIPLSALLYFLQTFFYRKTGKIYLGAFISAVITVWFLIGGGVVGAGL
ncbi:MAG: alpha/beta hydrolase [Candidatus Lokiarchaeota archaeon]|nr:alpha/beta hydrolase [Candidatus Lokiarchaeota archaeon]